MTHTKNIEKWWFIVIMAITMSFRGIHDLKQKWWLWNCPQLIKGGIQWTACYPRLCHLCTCITILGWVDRTFFKYQTWTYPRLVHDIDIEYRGYPIYIVSLKNPHHAGCNHNLIRWCVSARHHQNLSQRSLPNKGCEVSFSWLEMFNQDTIIFT